MGLKGGDSVRKAEVKIKRCENPKRIRWERFMQIGKPVKFLSEIPTCLLHELIETVWIFHSTFEKRIIETNNEINIPIINLKFLFYGCTLDLADDYKKSHDADSTQQ